MTYVCACMCGGGGGMRMRACVRVCLGVGRLTKGLSRTSSTR